MALVPLIERGGVVVLFANTKANKKTSSVVADGLSIIGAVAEALRLFLSHFGDEAAPPSVIDEGGRTPCCLLLVSLALAGAALADMMQVQDGRPSACRDVLQRGDKSCHVAVAILVPVVNPAQGIQYDQSGTGTEFDNARKVLVIHYVHTFAHDGLDDQVLRDGFTCLLIQVLTNGMDTAHQCDFRVFSSEIDHAASARGGKPYKIATGNAARDGHCCFQRPEALACSSGSYQRSYCACEKARPNEV